jgi:NAD(P)-dependent dehydrogenase (short-subunit alcohol dehydrogenase family)
MPIDYMSRFRLDGRVAVVTGAASGLGRAIAAGLADAGAALVVSDVNGDALRDLARSLTDEGHVVVPVTADVSDQGQVDRLISEACQVNGTLDAVLHVAGIGGRHAADTYPLDLWERVIRVNLTGAFLVAQAAGRVMLQQGHGSIVTVASVGGIVGWPGSVGYQASKAGVGQLSRSLGVEWAPRGVRVNSIAPGAFDTPAVRAEAEAEPDISWSDMSIYPMGRMGEDHEIVNAAIFLASDASRYMTGQVLVVDGGLTAR